MKKIRCKDLYVHPLDPPYKCPALNICSKYSAVDFALQFGLFQDTHVLYLFVGYFCI